MSDSLNATVIVSVFVLTISANPELEPLEDELEPPRLPAVAAPPVAEDDDDDDEELDDPLEEDPPLDTESPGVRLDSEAIVPLVGAYSLVLLTPISAVCTAACALYTAAWAEARLLGDGVAGVVVVGVDVVFAAELLPLDGDEPPEDDDRVVLGTTTVTVTLGVVFVTLVTDLVGVWPDPLVGFLFLPGPGLYAANSTVPLELGV
jgi:hypothetical protein